MLRISKKEKRQLYNINSRIRRKIKRLQTTFNIERTYDITTPMQFTTRQEVNEYKRQAKIFLSRYNEPVKLGVKENSIYHYYTTREKYNYAMKLVRNRNNDVYRLRYKAKQIPLTVKGKTQEGETLLSYVDKFKPKDNKRILQSRFTQFFPLTLQKASIRSAQNLDNFIYALEHFQTGKAFKKINKQAKNNFMQALYNTFGSNAEPIIILINELGEREFMEFYESDTMVDFDYIYDPSKAMEVLSTLSNSILRFIANSLEFTKRKYVTDEFVEMTENVKKIGELDSVSILNEVNYNVRDFTDPNTGIRYHGVFRKREAMMIDEGHITPDILKKAKKVNNVR